MVRLTLVILVALVVGGLVALGVASRRQRSGGWLGKRLEACGESPNCVSSMDSRARHRVAPLPVVGDADEAFLRVIAAVRTLPGARVVVEESGYVHAECASRLFGFVDDLELGLDADRRVIHVRSSSRIGKSDLGANRRRVELLRRRYAPSRAGG